MFRRTLGRRGLITGATADIVMDGHSSLALFGRARGGDATALEELFRRYLPSLRRWASSRLPARARDFPNIDQLVRDSLTHAIHGLPELEPASNMWHGALRIAILDCIRDKCHGVGLPPAAASLDHTTFDAGLSLLEIAIGNEAMGRYESGLARLSELEREAVIARIEFGLDYADFAEYLGMSDVEGARVSVNRAVVHLAALMA